MILLLKYMTEFLKTKMRLTNRNTMNNEKTMTMYFMELYRLDFRDESIEFCKNVMMALNF
jgi:hypothetical protein